MQWDAVMSGRIGIMQGRLSPPEGDRLQAFPRASWAEEFSRAAAAGLASIEWIFDVSGEDVNPLATAEGIERMGALSRHHGVAVRSVCADYFLDLPLARTTETERQTWMAKLQWLLERCQQAGIDRVVLPFVDASGMTTREDQERVRSTLAEILPSAQRLGVEIHLETNLDPAAFRRFLDRLPALKVNYDSGNSAALGYHPHAEFAAYGRHIGSVHIKDRPRGGGTVPLGTGAVDFRSVFNGLRALGYAGDFILQVARAQPGAELAWARQNCAFIQRYLHTH